jgi:hypothetical protein
MSLYARSDLAYVNVPTTSGGCGSPHRRPVQEGAPTKLWGLDCLACSDVLRHHDHWSPTLSEIPETYDEGKAREDFTKRGAADRDQVMALAMAKLAGVELPDTLRFALTGHMQDSPRAMMVCPNGHDGKPGAKFCAQCGEAMQQPAGDVPPALALCPAGHQNLAVARFCGECGTSMAQDAPAAQEPAEDPEPAGPAAPAGTGLADLHVQTLGKLARDQGLDASGGKAEIIARLQDA